MISEKWVRIYKGGMGEGGGGGGALFLNFT